MLDLLSIFSRHELDEWRDAYAFAAAGALREEAVSLAESMDERIASAALKDIVLGPQAFLQRELAPAMEESVLRLQNDLFAKAEEDYLRLVGSPLVWHREDHASSHEVTGFDGWQDVASAAAPLAVGGGVAAAIPFAAVSTSTALFGLITTTVVSWPVVVGGAAIAGTAIATGALVMAVDQIEADGKSAGVHRAIRLSGWAVSDGGKMRAVAGLQSASFRCDSAKDSSIGSVGKYSRPMAPA